MPATASRIWRGSAPFTGRATTSVAPSITQSSSADPVPSIVARNTASGWVTPAAVNRRRRSAPPVAAAAGSSRLSGRSTHSTTSHHATNYYYY